jgi:hypothetical protein
MDPIGKYDAWITLNGLRLTTKQGISPVRQVELTPDIGWANCNSSPGNWFKVRDGSGNYWCLGGGGSKVVSISNVVEIDTGNNWGHYQLFGHGMDSFSYYQTIYPGGWALVEVWLYE